MTGSACAAGIDAGRDFLDIAVAPSGRTRRLANAPQGVAALVAWRKGRPVLGRTR